jgi:hypothetical protein
VQRIVHIGVKIHRQLHGRVTHQPVKDRRIALAELLSDPAAEPLPQPVHR